jgi:hypothetical protein
MKSTERSCAQGGAKPNGAPLDVERISFQRSGFKLLLEILVCGNIRSVEEIPFTFGQRCRGACRASAKAAVDFARPLARPYVVRFGLRRF